MFKANYMDNKTFIEELSNRSGIDKETAQALTAALCTAISECVVDEDSVAIPGFGSFEPKKKLERVVVHPSSGKKLLVPPKLTILFKPSALLKQKIRNL